MGEFVRVLAGARGVVTARLLDFTGWAEGWGHGDVFLNARYVAGVAQRWPGARLLVRPEMRRVLSRLALPVTTPGECDPAAVMAAGPASHYFYWPTPPPPADLWADPDLRLAPTPRPRVGLAWYGFNGPERDYRGPPGDTMAPLLDLPLDFLALHETAPPLPAAVYRLPHLDAFGVTDWAGTAAVVRQLDLVITSDTALVHLAASLGAPTWLLDSGSLDMYDLAQWYPAIERRFRLTPDPHHLGPQSAARWAPVFADVRRALRARAA